MFRQINGNLKEKALSLERAFSLGDVACLFVGPQLKFMESRYDLFTQKFDRPHGVFVLHGAFVSVDMNISRTQTVDDLRELPGDGFRAANDDVVDPLQLIIGRRVTELRGAGA